MKKKLFYILIIVISGLIVGRKIYNATENIEMTFHPEEKYYFIQEGVYSSREIMEENIKEIDMKVVDYKNEKYHVYVGITKDENIAKRIKSIYENDGYQIYIKEQTLSNEEFLNNVIQFDLLINNAKTTKELLTIEEVVLANYEEIVQKNN